LAWIPASRFASELTGPAGDPNIAERELLRVELRRIRSRAAQLADRIAVDLPEFTVHNVTHLDALWPLVDLVVGDAVYLTPPEIFVLGTAILLHDLGLAVAAYPAGRQALREQSAWADAVAIELRQRLGHVPSPGEAEAADIEVLLHADQSVLRAHHAAQADQLGLVSWEVSGTTLYLIADEALRAAYGHIVGLIAGSHWLDVDQLPNVLPTALGAAPGMPDTWTLRPLLLAAILRCADVLHLSADRAPQWSRLGRELGPLATLHWTFQERLLQPRLVADRVEFTSSRPFPPEAANAWWLCLEALRIVDKELDSVDSLLDDNGLPRFAARSVRGVEDPLRLAKLVAVTDWVPIDARVEVSNVARLVSRIGGYALYGFGHDHVPLRELIQNACDAVSARSFLEPGFLGEVVVRCGRDEHGLWIEVADDGIGMAPEVLSGALLDFGRSLWDSEELSSILPGLAASRFTPTGRFGIGFFSIFMWADRVTVTSRGVSSADTWVLQFEAGLTGRPLLRRAGLAERHASPGTRVRLWGTRGFVALIETPEQLDGELAALLPRLCPSLEVSLSLDSASGSVPLVGASDWLSVDGDVLLARVATQRAGDGLWQYLASALRTVETSDGAVVARIALDPRGNHGALAAGGLYVSSLSRIAGVVVAHGTDAARSSGVALLPRKEMIEWATKQVDLLTQTTNVFDQNVLAPCVAGLGASPASLAFCAVGGQGYATQEQLLEWCKDKNEVVVADTHPELDRCGREWQVGAYSQVLADDVIDATRRNQRLEPLRFADGLSETAFPSPFDVAVATVEEALRARAEPARRVLGHLTTPPHPIPGIPERILECEGECVVIRRG
jgi:hypothetical protein